MTSKANACVRAKLLQSCLTLCKCVDCSPHQAPLSMGFSREEYLEWIAMSSSRRSSQGRDQTRISCTGSKFFTTSATWEVPKAHTAK